MASWHHSSCFRMLSGILCKGTCPGPSFITCALNGSVWPSRKGIWEALDKHFRRTPKCIQTLDIWRSRRFHIPRSSLPERPSPRHVWSDRPAPWARWIELHRWHPENLTATSKDLTAIPSPSPDSERFRTLDSLMQPGRSPSPMLNDLKQPQMKRRTVQQESKRYKKYKQNQSLCWLLWDRFVSKARCKTHLSQRHIILFADFKNVIPVFISKVLLAACYMSEPATNRSIRPLQVLFESVHFA